MIWVCAQREITQGTVPSKHILDTKRQVPEILSLQVGFISGSVGKKNIEGILLRLITGIIFIDIYGKESCVY